jgi:hypothetical protein
MMGELQFSSSAAKEADAKIKHLEEKLKQSNDKVHIKTSI